MNKILLIDVRLVEGLTADDLTLQRRLAWRVEHLVETGKMSRSARRKINRIKTVRTLTGLGLHDAKKWVEDAFVDYGKGDIA